MKLKSVLKTIDWGTVFTIAGVLNTIATCVVAAMDGAEAGRFLDALEEDAGVKEKAETALPHFGRTFGLATVTIGCEIAANVFNKKEIRRLNTALAVMASQIPHYRKVVAGEVGAEKEKELWQKADEERLEVYENSLGEAVHIFRDPVNDITFEATTKQVLDGLHEMQRQISNGSCGRGITYWSDFYTVLDRPELINDSAMRSGFAYDVIFYSWDTDWIGFYLEPKKDRLGREYYVIQSTVGCSSDVDRDEEELCVMYGGSEFGEAGRAIGE